MFHSAAVAEGSGAPALGPRAETALAIQQVAGQHLPHRDAQRPDVGLAARPLPPPAAGRGSPATGDHARYIPHHTYHTYHTCCTAYHTYHMPHTTCHTYCIAYHTYHMPHTTYHTCYIPHHTCRTPHTMYHSYCMANHTYHMPHTAYHTQGSGDSRPARPLSADRPKTTINELRGCTGTHTHTLRRDS